MYTTRSEHWQRLTRTAAWERRPVITCYLTYDHQGTTRLITDANANVIARHDYLPFGEEIPGGIAGRSASQFGPGLDNVNQKFTGQERDSESGLDFFQARYFGGALGRFLSPDPGNAGAALLNPQSWNGYSYATNNPLNRIDPRGKDPITFSVTSICGGACLDDDFGGGGGNPQRSILLGPDPSSGYQNSLAAQDAAKNLIHSAFSGKPPTSPSQPQKPKPPADDLVINLDVFHSNPKLWSIPRPWAIRLQLLLPL